MHPPRVGGSGADAKSRQRRNGAVRAGFVRARPFYMALPSEGVPRRFEKRPRIRRHSPGTREMERLAGA
jgi:hypothetical protein